ncbi:hypothetical protein, partial [Lentzea sp.]|uniref:hypothetical protein n=1 Tax=Lentzea sp. TaxID=56099 RepID=UPI002C37D78D
MIAPIWQEALDGAATQVCALYGAPQELAAELMVRGHPAPGARLWILTGSAAMAKSRGKRGHIGTSMGGSIVRLPPRPPLQRTNKSCPVCYSVAGQPCRRVESKPGAAKLKLGSPIPTM